MRNGRSHYTTISIVDAIVLYAIFFFATLLVHDVILMARPSHTPAIRTVLAAANQAPGIPMRLVIPNIGVDASVQSVGVTAGGKMGIPSGDNRYREVGWFSPGVKPGEKGSAVIDGHVDTRSFEAGVFRDLNRLRIGDVVQIVDSSGQLFEFRVIGRDALPAGADTAGIFASAGTARLNLITCSGDWVPEQKQYDQRLVIYTELIR